MGYCHKLGGRKQVAPTPYGLSGTILKT
eukprot:SAG11_NODE_9167_length_936_cov_0.913978_2_plen_27_part_01